MDVSRRGLLLGGLGVLAVGGGAIAAAQALTRDAPAEPVAGPSGAATASTTASPTAPPDPTDLDLHAWDTVRRDLANSPVSLTGGALPAGLAIVGSVLVGRPATTGPYAFEVSTGEGAEKVTRSFAGKVGVLKRDLSVSLSLDDSTPLKVTAKELDRIARLGANATLVVLCYIDDPTSTTFTRVSDERVDAALAMAREKGVRVTLLKPHIVTRKDGDAFYRGNYAPASVDAFFAAWQAQLVECAKLCADRGIEYLSLTCEQPQQTEASQFAKWQTLVGAVRAAAPVVKLTAAFTTLELFLLSTYWLPQGVPHMAQLLDVFGINSWIRLTDKVYTPKSPNITVDELVAGWRGAGGTTDDHLGKLEAVCDRLRIPFLVTEVGVQPRVDGLARQEGSTPPVGATNHDVQALLYESVLKAPLTSRWCTGASIWHVRAPFAFGDLSKDTLLAGEKVLKSALERTPALAASTF